MNLKNGKRIDKFVTDSWGEGGYVFWIDSSFDPCTYFVRGDSFTDAMEWFECHAPIAETLKIDNPKDYGFDNWEDFEKKFTTEGISGVTINADGVLIDTESINGTELWHFAR